MEKLKELNIKVPSSLFSEVGCTSPIGYSIRTMGGGQVIPSPMRFTEISYKNRRPRSRKAFKKAVGGLRKDGAGGSRILPTTWRERKREEILVSLHFPVFIGTAVNRIFS